MFSVQAANCRPNVSGVFINIEDWSSSDLFYRIVPDGVLDLGIGTFFRVVVVGGSHCQHCSTRTVILSHGAIVNRLKMNYKILHCTTKLLGLGLAQSS